MPVPKGYKHQRLNATKLPTELDWCWAAGLYEGEGSCAKTQTTVMAAIGQKDPQILHWMRELFGGSVKDRYMVWHNNKPYKMWTWYVTGARAREFLSAIFPRMSDRRKKQIKRALEEGDEYRRPTKLSRKACAGV